MKKLIAISIDKALLSFILLLFYLFMLYGRKISFIDLSIIVGIGGIFFLFVIKKNIFFPKAAISLPIILFFILLYSIIIFYSYTDSSTYFIFRNLRALFSTILIIFFVSNFPVSVRAKYDLLVLALLLHSLVIILGTIFPELKPYMYDFLGFSKRIYDYRSIGLASGYDTSGAFVLFGMILSYFRFIYQKNMFYNVAFICFAVSIFFTSRINMILCVILLVTFTIIAIRNNKALDAIKYLIILLVIFLPIFVLITNSIVLSDGSFKTIEIKHLSFIVENYRTTYPQTDFFQTFAHHYDFTDAKTLFFGSGFEPQMDPGYTKIIYMNGILGLILIMLFFLFYCRIIWIINKEINSLNQVNTSKDYFIANSVFYSALFFIPLIFFHNFKILFFLTRGIHEFTIIVLSILISLNRHKYKYQ